MNEIAYWLFVVMVILAGYTMNILEITWIQDDDSGKVETLRKWNRWYLYIVSLIIGAILEDYITGLLGW